MALKSILAGGIAVALLAGGSSPAAAQANGNEQQNWFVAASGWGKWVSLGVAAGLMTYGAVRANGAQDRFTTLESACRVNSASCRIGGDGLYIEAEAERLFQETLSLDGQAQKLLLGGQVSLVLSGAMFLVDLLSGDHEPGNIPFTQLQVYSRPDRIGLQIGF